MKANPLVKEVIESLGGHKVAASTLCVSEDAVKIWPYRGSIPKRYWKKIQTLVPAITVEQLTGWVSE